IEEKMVRLAAYLGLQQHSFDGVLRWILELREIIGIPPTLAQLGVRAEHVGIFAPQAFDDPSTGGNPVPMSVDSFAGLYRNCIAGELRAG
ncbi:MAG TPA: iron-containing alcohol dehydrogenase, partial [Povalibacter sp.]